MEAPPGPVAGGVFGGYGIYGALGMAGIRKIPLYVFTSQCFIDPAGASSRSAFSGVVGTACWLAGSSLPYFFHAF